MTSEPIAASLADSSPRAAVASAHPVATQAGIDILEAGGNAIDAALAVAFALNVVEPHASGLGGGGFLVFHDASTGEDVFIDYRETAPASLQPEHYSVNGSPNSSTMRGGGMAVGAPGMLRGLMRMHAERGTMPIADLIAPAIAAAENGVEVSNQLALHSANRADDLMADDHAGFVFLQDGIFPLDEGQTITQPAMAETLRRIAAQGEDALYSGDGAEAIARRVQEAGGVLEASDIAVFEPRWRDPLRTTYRGYDIVTVGPPSAGGIQVAYILGVLEHLDFTGLDANDPFVLAALAAAAEQAAIYARDHVADPRYMELEVSEILSENRIAATRNRIKSTSDIARLDWQYDYEELVLIHDGNTTHLSVIDEDGNAVALTQTINSFFGSGVMVGELGLMLNNEMFDFDFSEGSVNLPGPGKIPRSSMAPVLVFRDGHLVGTIGTPGGTRIPQSLARIISGKIDFDLSLQDAIDLPRIFVNPNVRRVHFETRIDNATMEQALSMVDFVNGDYTLREQADFDHYFGGAHACWIDESPAGRIMSGAADPRRDGAAMTLPPLAR